MKSGLVEAIFLSMMTDKEKFAIGIDAECLTCEVCALREEEKLQGLSDVTEVIQHVLHVLLVLGPTALNKDKARHLHCPAWKNMHTMI